MVNGFFQAIGPVQIVFVVFLNPYGRVIQQMMASCFPGL